MNNSANINYNEAMLKFHSERLAQLTEMRQQLEAATDEPIVLKLLIGDKSYEYPIDSAQTVQFISDFIANCEGYHDEEHDSWTV